MEFHTDDEQRVSPALGALQDTAQGVYAEPPMTGSLRNDLLSWLGTAEQQASRVGAATFRGLVGEANQAEFEHVGALMAARARDVERCIIEPARQRGEVTRDIPKPVITLFFTLLRDQTLFSRLEDHDSTAIVDYILHPLLTRNAQP